MDIYVLNKDFQSVGIIDTYESFIWTDRFRSYGDFELYTPFDQNILTICQQGYYLHINESEHKMIIEGIEITTDYEVGIRLRITGRSLESILDRRIIWQKTIIDANTKFQTAIKDLIEDAFIDPQPYSGTRVNKRRSTKQQATSDLRKMVTHPIVFIETDDEYINSLKVEKVQYTGDNLYEVLLEFIENTNNSVGFQITLNETTDPIQFEFKLYSGTDRSYEQKEYRETYDETKQEGKTYYTYDEQTQTYVEFTGSTFDPNTTYYEYRGILPFVVFSPNFDNIINTDYIDSIETMKNVTLVAGEEKDDKRKTVIVGSESDLERREYYTDARDIRSEDYPNNYAEVLENRGYNSLVENSRTTSYDGQVDATRQFVFGEHFKMGDIIQMSNEYGIDGSARVIEWVMSDSDSGHEIYPTFDAVQLIDDTTVEEDEEEQNV